MAQRAILAAILSCTAVLCPSIAPAQDKPVEKQIPGDTPWTDTGIEMKPGDTVIIEASGTIQYPAQKPNGPEGLSRAWTDLIRILPVNEAGRGALIGKIGDRDASRPFLVGQRREQAAAVGGKLFLGVNVTGADKATGAFVVKITRTAASPSPASVDNQPPASKLTQEQLDSIPPRVEDDQGTKGDRVNFILVGSEDKVTAAFKAAGWVTVDRSNKDAVLRGIFSSLSKQAYVTLPMSTLQLFGRGQDYGYAQGDPIRVVASRHHFRIWKAPFDLNGTQVWAGAGTHDIGFDRDQRNNKLTHKIDPDVDQERDYIGRSLSETGLVSLTDYMTAKDTVKEAKTAHGEVFHSDGRTLIIYLKSDNLNSRAAFADLFCSVLKQNNPDGGEWGGCSQYIDGEGREDLSLGKITTDYRVLIVPGIFSSCASDAPAFMEGQKVLKEKYGLDVDLLNIPNDSSEDNARKIADYLREHMATDKRKYLALGYSKGAPDLQTALAKEDGVKSAVAAFITVAGASGGSPIADAMPGLIDKWAGQYNFGSCKGDVITGFKSLRTDVRRAFLAAYPNPVVPTYSMVAVSDLATTSKALQKGWQLMSTFAKAHDGQLTRDDATVPGAKFLGVARADHLAVALPFDKTSDQTIRNAMDKARYPRGALLEALVRFVSQDLQPK